MSHPRKVTSFSFADDNVNVCTKSTMQTPKFGIIAALTKDGIIGCNGKLPWASIAQDRDHFVNTTRNKILIVGRKTFADEDQTGSHIKHVRVCIVVSRTIDASDLVSGKGHTKGPDVKLARTFDEALHLSRELSGNNDLCKTDGDIDCWVAGGERIYREALQHSICQEVHLTHIDMTLEDQTSEEKSIAYFPIDCLTQNGFEEVSRVNSGLCTFSVYKRQLPAKK